MGARTDPHGASGPERESYGKVLANLGSVLIALAILGAVIATEPRAPRPVSVPKPAVPELVAARPAAPKPIEAPAPAPPPPLPVPEPPRLDREAVARAEQALDAASRDRERAEGRADDAARRLAGAVEQAAAEARAARSLAFRVRDPSTRISQAAARGGFVRAERDKLKGEVAALATIPRPKAKVLSNKNPVARPSDGDECHFELRRNRVSWIDLDKLLSLVKADAMLRIRLSENSRSVDSRVGPIGPFSLEYTMARSLPGSLEDLMGQRRIAFDLRGWEIVPEFEGRGETYEATLKPISEFARAINRLNPTKSTVTLWVYPDSFVLFRKLREDLQARGYLVAARPLPDGMAIRGSPAGSLSAGQ
jgi:hypothetical protein